MSNHGTDNNDMPDSIKAQLDKALAPKMTQEEARRLLYDGMEKLGATGRFPMGKLTAEDEGEIKFALAADPKTKTIILDFGKPVAWLGLPREDARKMANLILERVKELE